MDRQTCRTAIQRLKHSSPAELAYRLKIFLFELRSLRLAPGESQSGRCSAQVRCNWKRLHLPAFEKSPGTELAGMGAGGRHAPASLAVEDVHIRDIRSEWEPARLQHVAAAIAGGLWAGDSSAQGEVRQFVSKTVLGWIRENPFPHGPHYTCAMECGLRVPVFFYALKALGYDPGPESRIIAEAIHRHAWWISGRLSLYSSLGNHTVCEAVGLVFAGALFRGTQEGDRWLKTGIDLLEQEVGHQILPDGGPVEQSFNYHRFVLDLYWLAADFLESNHLHDCRSIKPLLRRGERFLLAFQDGNGHCPAIGDSDDGHAVAPGIHPRREVDPLQPADLMNFPDSGYSVLRGGHGAVLTFDHGPLGMPPLYNHGHADALSVTLSVAGNPILVDPGTYRYNGVPEHRRYFKGTRAHNTVTIDGVDQAVQETGFIWSRPYQAELVDSFHEADFLGVVGAHSGYARLREPVWHKRSVFLVRGDTVVINDAFEGQGIHTFELNYHLHPEASVVQQEQGWHISLGKASVFMKLLGGSDLCYFHGQTEPLLGWFSPAYGVKMPSGVLQCRKVGEPAEVRFETILFMDGIG